MSEESPLGLHLKSYHKQYIYGTRRDAAPTEETNPSSASKPRRLSSENSGIFLVKKQKAARKGSRDLLTPQPGVRDVLEHGDRDAEEDNEQVAERQGADEDVGDRAHGLAAGHHIDHQGVAEERQGEDEQASEQKGQPGSRGQLRGEHQWSQPIARDELCARQVVQPQQLRELL